MSRAVAAGIVIVGGTHLASANLVITPAFDSTITSDPNAAAIEAGINATISRVDSYISNNVTVNITFQEGGGLGESSTYITSQSYATYKTELATAQTLPPDDTVAIATLPVSLSAVNGNASSTVTTSLPLLRALGVSANPPVGQPDSTVTLNTSLMNLSRTGIQDPDKYDLQAVAGHEIDEVLSAGGGGSSLPSTTTIGALDLFRFSAAGVRSYTASTSAAPYFSIDGGVTDFVHFNEYSGADYADWGDGVTPAEANGNTPPQMQDAFGTTGVDIDIGKNELASLDVIGWNLTPAGLLAEATVVPEPATIGMLVAAAAFGLTGRRRSRRT